MQDFRTYGAEGHHGPCGDRGEETPTSSWTANHWSLYSIYRWAVLISFHQLTAESLCLSCFYQAKRSLKKFSSLQLLFCCTKRKIKCIFKPWGRRQTWVLQHGLSVCFGWCRKGEEEGGSALSCQECGWPLTIPSQWRKFLWFRNQTHSSTQVSEWCFYPTGINVLLQSCTRVVMETLNVPFRWSFSHLAAALTHNDLQ